MARNFTDVLGELERGDVARELSEELAALVVQCRQTGKSGKLGVLLTVKPSGRVGDGCHVSAKINPDPPKLDRESTYMFDAGDGSLSRRDVRQPELPYDVATKAEVAP